MTTAFTQKDAPASPRLPGGCWATYPDEQLGQDHVALPAGQVQRRPAVSLPAGFVHLVPGAVRQQQDDRPQVLVGRGPQQVLAQGQLCAGQRGQEELLLVLGPDPPLLLLPARASRGARSQSRGGGRRRPLCPAASLCGVCPGGRQGRGHVRDECAHRHQEALQESLPCSVQSGSPPGAPPGARPGMQTVRPHPGPAPSRTPGGKCFTSPAGDSGSAPGRADAAGQRPEPHG